MKVRIVEVNSILSKSKLGVDYVINPYVGCPHACIYCYAMYMSKFTEHSEVWGTFVDVKKPKKKINVYKLYNKKILLSSVTDPYNPVEKEYGVTRKVLEELLGSYAQIEILTKSNLVLRDLDLLKKLNATVGFSLCTLDDSFRKRIEPFASNVEERIDALRILKNEGLTTYLFVAPIFPKITNVPQIVNLTKEYVDFYLFENLNLRSDYKENILKMIKAIKPELFELYKRIYVEKDKTYWRIYKEKLVSFCEKEGLKFEVYFHE